MSGKNTDKLNDDLAASALVCVSALQAIFMSALAERRETQNDSCCADQHRYTGFVLRDIVIAVIDAAFIRRAMCEYETDVLIDVECSNEHDGVFVNIHYVCQRADVSAKEVAEVLARHLGVNVTCSVDEHAGRHHSVGC